MAEKSFIVSLELLNSAYSFLSMPSELMPKEQQQLATTLIRFGTSSWVYPGWKGSIYKKNYSSEKSFRQESLAEYAAHEQFRTVGIDSFFYAPPSIEKLQNYKEQVPNDFQWVSKVWERITVPRYPNHARYGENRAEKNPDFLKATLFQDEVLQAYEDAGVADNTGPFVFQFPYIAKEELEAKEFFKQLDSFLARLPKEWRYAVEVRNQDYLMPDYFHILNTHRVTHCFNHWSYMPSLKQQMQQAAAAGGLIAPFYVSRILTPLGVNYAQAVKLFSPYKTLQSPIESMREDVIRLVKRALSRSVQAFVIVNNRAEGHAPGTIVAILEGLLTNLFLVNG